jgi:hypothetical protein
MDLENQIRSFFDQGYLSVSLDADVIGLSRTSVLIQISNAMGSKFDLENFQNYQTWISEGIVNHELITDRQIRHFNNEELAEALITNALVQGICGKVFNRGFRVWDEGYGQFAYRLIRSKGNDGYPLSKKTWGPGGFLLSICIPIHCTDPKSGVGVVPKSHLREFLSTEDVSGKFEAGERRYAGETSALDVVRPMRAGHMLLMHPDLLHCEAVAEGADQPRLSLEMRICEQRS